MRFETARLAVRSPEKKDAYDIFRNYAQDAEVTKYLTWEPHLGVEQSIQWIDHCIEHADTPESLILVIFHKSAAETIGMLDFRIDDFKAEFGYVLAKKFWNQGIMTEAMRPALDYMRTIPEIYRIWAVHDVDNPASGKVMQKLGLSFEGTLKGFCMHPNISKTPRDAKLYALVKNASI